MVINGDYTLWLFDITMERSTRLLMGKSTISTGPFSIAMLNYQRVVSIVVGII
jgi:hypothetical protein